MSAKMTKERTAFNSESSFDRLKHALNSLEGREKYRTRTNSPSDGDDVRWYFSKSPLSLQDVAASSPSTEIVGKSDFLRFSVHDSLALEAAFLKVEEDLVSAWWKEYAECSEGPLGALDKGQPPSSGKDPTGTTESEIARANGVKETLEQLDDLELYESNEVIGVSVKGGLYEVDLYRRRCFPVYWTGDHRRVLRGHWFAQKDNLDWLPLREDVSEQLEFAYRSQIWHRRTFQPSGKFAARVNLQSSIEGLHALFTGEDDTWESWLGMESSGISSVLRLRGNYYKLRRGFAPSQSPRPTLDELRQRKEEEMDDYCSQVPVRHLVFMVHGIGQRLEKANLVDDVGTFRHTTTLLAEQHLTKHQRNSLRVLFIPCQWRRGLKLGGEEAVENCTLEGVRALRTMLSATVHDVLYYMSPVYCQDIIDSVSGQLNKLYCKFIKRNPGYDGKVSIYGHSLGSVLSFDILCHQKKLTSSTPVSQLQERSLNVRTTEPQHTRVEHDSDLSEPQQPDDILCHEKKLTSSSPMNQLHERSLNVRTTEAQHTRVECDSDLSEPQQPENSHVQNQYGEQQPDEPQVQNAYIQEPSKPGTDDAEIDNLRKKKQGTDFEQCPERNAADCERPDLMSKKELESIKQDSSCSSGSSSSQSSKQANRQRKYSKPRSSSRKRYTPYIEYTKLAFEVDTFFAVGSPIGVFLSLRNIRLGIGNGKDYWRDDGIDEEMPACKRLFNVFHPFDPVAYRIEPLVCKEYMHNQPVFVPYHKGGRRLHIGMQEFGKEMSARSRAFVHSINVAGDRVAKVFSSTAEKDDKEDIQIPKDRTYGSLMIEKLTGDPEGRIDYMLQDSTFEHQYLQAISSHTAYWQDCDTALFIIKHLYRDIPEESPKSTLESTNSEGMDDSVSLDPAPFLNQDALSDELPLTFSLS